MLFLQLGCFGLDIELHIWPNHQHEWAQRLYGRALIHRQIYPQLVHVSRPCSFQEH